jgi:hypothetical protein
MTMAIPTNMTIPTAMVTALAAPAIPEAVDLVALWR